MSKKLVVLLAALARAGFVSRGGKGSHRNYEHPCGHRLTVSVHKGEAKPYQQRDIEEAIAIAEAWTPPSADEN
jgi:predicted RNA binding protein YcfA (HicA-like mRNA interferase family)